MSNHPKVNVEALTAPMTDAEFSELCREFEDKPKTDWRKFVADVRAHPEKLISWDSSESFEEFAKRVDAGEYD